PAPGVPRRDGAPEGLLREAGPSQTDRGQSAHRQRDPGYSESAGDVSMIAIKNERELEVMRRACKITAAARALAGEMVRPGVTTKEIDKAVHDFIVAQGAKPSFLNYSGYPASACISVNDVVIHGIPDGYKLKEGDIVSVDVGACWNGFHGDCAATFACG